MKSLAARLLAFILLLALLQLLVATAFPAEIPQEVLRLEEHLSNRVDIIYLGDSTLTYPVGEVTTGEILREMLPDHALGEVSHPAYNLDVYLHYVRYIIHCAHRPRVVILPINMRSFSPEWDMRPTYQFEDVKKTLELGPLVSRILWRPLKAFGVFASPISQDTFLNTRVYNGDTPVGTVRDFEGLTEEGALGRPQGDTGFVYHDVLPSADDTEALRQALIYRYMYGLEPDHRQLRAMRRIAELGDENNLDIVFYITPINYQQGQRFLGDAFVTNLTQNVKVVKSSLTDSPSSTILDLSSGLEAYAFVDMEHLRETGKVYVAEQLAAAMRPEWSAASSGSGGEAQPTIPPPESNTAAPTATSTSTRPSPSPTVIQPAPTATATRTATPTAVTAVTLTPTLTKPTPSPPVPTAVATVVPSTTVPVSPTATLTMTPTIAAHEELVGGTVVEVEYLWRSWPEGPYAVDMYRLRYQTLDEDGQIAETRADLFVPQVETTTTFPLLVEAAGTTGLGNGCAPLNEQAKERNWGNYRGYSLSYAAQGYMVILPNGLGFDDPDRIHPYFIAELQAHVLLDAARAVYNLAENSPTDDMLARPADAVFFMGYSSGGHAAFAAKDWAGSYAPELPVKGIMGFGPTTNAETLLREDPVFSPYIVYAYRDFYGSEIIDVADVFLPAWLPTFSSDVLNKCVDDIFSYYSRSAREMYSPEFRDVLYNDRLDQVFPAFAEKLSANSTGVSGGERIPVLILQGTADTVVTPDSQRAFKEQLCGQGTVVTYLEYAAVPHYEIRRVSFGDTLSWMGRIVEGSMPRTDCEAGNAELEP